MARLARLARKKKGDEPPVDAPEGAAVEEKPRRRRTKDREHSSRRERPLVGSGGPTILTWVTEKQPPREELEREADAEMRAIAAGSYDMLRVAVPGATSPDEALREIESHLEPTIEDPDDDVPDHPIYEGDALVYSQLRRHYGPPAPGGSFRRSWQPGDRGGMPPMLGGG